MAVSKITSRTVRGDFDDPRAVVHYTRAARGIGLWRSERLLLERHIPKTARILEAGCGAGRVAVVLAEEWRGGVTAFDFSEELLEQARRLAGERGLKIAFHHADARRLAGTPVAAAGPYDAVVFLFNGLMQIPLRRERRRALRQLRALAAPGGVFLFTTHDRDSSVAERLAWRLERPRWENGTRDPRLREFGDRYFEDDVGRTFMHLPDRAEVLGDLRATGWAHRFDAMRDELAREPRAVREFSDNCRFWVAENP